MKAFITILIIAALAGAGWYFREDISKALGIGSPKKIAEGGGTPPETPKTGTAPSTEGTPKAEDKDPLQAKKDALVAEIKAKYPKPNIRPLEAIVQDWKAIPPKAFPRMVKLTADVQFKRGETGSVTIPSGSEVKAVRMQDPASEMVLINRPNTQITAVTELDNTTFKQELTAFYEDWKKRKLNDVLTKMRQEYRARVAALEREAAGEPPVVASNNTASSPPPGPNRSDKPKDPAMGPIPKQNGDGTVPVMVASIEKGEVTEIELGRIEKWGRIYQEEIQGSWYWVGPVEYKTETIFGVFDTEALALMRGGRVEKWVYSGSLEILP